MKHCAKVIVFKNYEFNCHGIEMNKRYDPSAVGNEGQKEPTFEKDNDLHYAPTTWSGARFPHIWLSAANDLITALNKILGH